MRPEEQDYFDALFACIDEQVFPVVRRVRFDDGTEPQPNECHENAARWVEENPEWRVAPGWLVSGLSAYGCCFDAHSIVADRSGRLFEITLPSATPTAFVSHRGSKAQFENILSCFKQHIYCCNLGG